MITKSFFRNAAGAVLGIALSATALGIAPAEAGTFKYKVSGAFGGSMDPYYRPFFEGGAFDGTFTTSRPLPKTLAPDEPSERILLDSWSFNIRSSDGQFVDTISSDFGTGEATSWFSEQYGSGNSFSFSGRSPKLFDYSFYFDIDGLGQPIGYWGRFFYSNMESDYGPNSSPFRTVYGYVAPYSTIPTPALLPGLIGMGVAALRKRKQEQAEAVEA